MRVDDIGPAACVLGETKYMATKIKPSWNHAPRWASWLLPNTAGDWCWLEQKPVMCRRNAWVSSGGKVEFAEDLGCNLSYGEIYSLLESRPSYGLP